MVLKLRKFGGGNRVLLCLHGFLGNHCDWEKFADSFLTSALGWQVVAIDLPGHGDEEGGWVCPEPEEFSKALSDLAVAEGWATGVLAGYSLGGRLALHTALSFPELFPVFIGISTMAGIEDEQERSRRTASDFALASRLRGGSEFSQFLREWWEQPIFESPSHDLRALEAFLASRLQRNPACMASCLETWSAGRMKPQWSALSDYPGSAFLLSGDADMKYTLAAGRMKACFRQADHVVIPQAGHQLISENPHFVALAIASFLKTHAIAML